MSDIVERLRAPVQVERQDGIRLEAAAEIVRLRHEISVLHAMLKDYERVYGTYGEER
jgi:hypothetical protein